MVVAELLRWGAPLQLVLCLVLLAFHEKALQSEDRVMQLSFMLPTSLDGV